MLSLGLSGITATLENLNLSMTKSNPMKYQGPSYQHGYTLTVYELVITCIIECGMELHIYSQTSTVGSLKYVNG